MTSIHYYPGKKLIPPFSSNLQYLKFLNKVADVDRRLLFVGQFGLQSSKSSSSAKTEHEFNLLFNAIVANGTPLAPYGPTTLRSNRTGPLLLPILGRTSWLRSNMQIASSGAVVLLERFYFDKKPVTRLAQLGFWQRKLPSWDRSRKRYSLNISRFTFVRLVPAKSP